MFLFITMFVFVKKFFPSWLNYYRFCNGPFIKLKLSWFSCYKLVSKKYDGLCLCFYQMFKYPFGFSRKCKVRGFDIYICNSMVTTASCTITQISHCHVILWCFLGLYCLHFYLPMCGMTISSMETFWKG